MKTSVVLKSCDRNLFGIIVDQDTKTHFLSVTDLQKAYEVARWQHGWSDRRINDIMQASAVQERVYYILENKGVIKATLPVFIEMLRKEGIVKVLKGLGIWKSTGTRGSNKVSCDPHIWVLLALEMNPMIYAKVVMWLTDSLIFNRIEAGDEFKPMNKSIGTVVANPDYGKIATSINEKVFGHHQSGMRNIASASELRKIADIEKFVKNAVDNGWIRTEVEVLNAIKNYK